MQYRRVDGCSESRNRRDSEVLQMNFSKFERVDSAGERLCDGSRGKNLTKLIVLFPVFRNLVAADPHFIGHRNSYVYHVPRRARFHLMLF